MRSQNSERHEEHCEFQLSLRFIFSKLVTWSVTFPSNASPPSEDSAVLLKTVPVTQHLLPWAERDGGNEIASDPLRYDNMGNRKGDHYKSYHL